MKTAEATVNAILLADNPETFVTRRITEVNLEFGGIPGDRHFGVTFPADSRQPMYPRGTEILNRRQITMLAEEDCAKIAAQLSIERVLPEWLGANILLNGFPELTRLTLGSRILFPNSTGLIVMGENQPCTFPGEVIQQHFVNQPDLATQFVRAAYKRRGIVCAVERPGKIYTGDTVQIYLNDYSNPMQ
ncbi:MOSC domain-containing protein [Bacillus sp. Marseille-P3661]|uniref:MOSC domain-containing protein n=1 Tax=Bacillus sp. Marseille-P3661 TaxID=1936234 RepID=UPI000C82D58B|nr:MOSC domain-containing protein [Bacillus sp. Marseille-P3661]